MARIPVHAPEWTDHDVSDPGVTLLELFAFLAENLGYRPRPDYFDGGRLQPGDLAAEQCYHRRKRRLRWTWGIGGAALVLVVVAARRRAKKRPTESDEEA